MIDRGLLRSLIIYYGGLLLRWRRLHSFYAGFIQPGDLCFDIGAHVGSRALVWRRLGARVAAVEPQPHMARLLRFIFGRSPSVTVLETAVGAEAGQATLYISRQTPTVTTLSSAWAERVKREDRSFAGVAWREQVIVPVTTLDELIERYGRPAFCKIDVEGYELEILRGLSQPLPALSFEVIPAAKEIGVGCVERLAAMGDYEFNWSPGERHEWAGEGWRSPERMIDWLAGLSPEAGSGDVYAQSKEAIFFSR